MPKSRPGDPSEPDGGDVEDRRSAPTYEWETPTEASSARGRARDRGEGVKYLLIMHRDRGVWAGLSEAERPALADGHREFRKRAEEAGELIAANQLADPFLSSVVRVHDGRVRVAAGPFREAEVFLTGYYLVDVEDEERTWELAAAIPEAGFGAWAWRSAR
jgi:hypothetical protein